MIEKKLVIYCSASYTISPIYKQAAREVVRAACLHGYTIVSGGAIKGTMGTVANEVCVCKGKQIGVLPKFMSQYKHPGLDKIVWTDTMSERKEKMREGTSIAIALPGGIGTLDELVETHVLAKLNKYTGRIIALNLDGFYNPYIALLDYYVKTDMMTRQERELVLFPNTVEELVTLLD